MLGRFILMVFVFILINLGMYVRLQLIHRSISNKDYKIFATVANIIYLVFGILYIIGIIPRHM